MQDKTLTRSQLSTSVTNFPTNLWTEKEAAVFLGVREKSLQAWRIRGGGPPFVKIGRLVRYRPSLIEEWLSSHERASTSDSGM